MQNRTFGSQSRFFALSLLLPFLLLIFAWPTIAEEAQEAPAPIAFHHVHLNSVDPQAAIKFYTKTFDVTKPATLAGMGGVQSEKMYLLFNKAAKAPATAPDSAIWHFAGGTRGMEPTYNT